MTRSGSKPKADLPDLVYVVRPGGDNEELRYSLRSVARNAPHRKVWIVGTVPSWVRNVEPLPLEPHLEKFANQRQSLEAACARDDLSDVFVLMNDDHFVTEKITTWPTFHLGSASGFIARQLEGGRVRNTWVKAVRATAIWMAEQGHGDVLCYEAHVPLLFNKAALGELLAAYPRGRYLTVGEMYAVAGAGGVGENAGNAKVKTDEEFDAKAAQAMPFLSSNETSFGELRVGEYVRSLFPTPSKYEEA